MSRTIFTLVGALIAVVIGVAILPSIFDGSDALESVVDRQGNCRVVSNRMGCAGKCATDRPMLTPIARATGDDPAVGTSWGTGQPLVDDRGFSGVPFGDRCSQSTDTMETGSDRWGGLVRATVTALVVPAPEPTASTEILEAAGLALKERGDARLDAGARDSADGYPVAAQAEYSASDAAYAAATAYAQRASSDTDANATAVADAHLASEKTEAALEADLSNVPSDYVGIVHQRPPGDDDQFASVTSAIVRLIPLISVVGFVAALIIFFGMDAIRGRGRRRPRYRVRRIRS